MRRNPDKDRVVTGSGREGSDHTGGLAAMADPTGRCQAEQTEMTGSRTAGASGSDEVSRQKCQDRRRQAVVEAPDRLERVTMHHRNLASRNGWTLPFNPEGMKVAKTARGGGGSVGGSEWTRPGAGLAEAYGWRHQRRGWYYIETWPAHQDQFNQAT